MLKKISGYTTKFLFYVRNNFLSFLFKSSVFLTLLALIYLVCVLKESNSMQKHQIEVQQVARSQKLILRIPSKTESPPSFTEGPTTMINFIPKVGINIGSHPSFPVQEQTTSSMIPVDATSPLPMQDQTVSSMEPTETDPLQDCTTPEMMSIEDPPKLPNMEKTTTLMKSIEEQSIFRFDEETTCSTPMTSSGKYLSLPALEETTSSVSQTERSFFPIQDQSSVTVTSDELVSSTPSSEETTPLTDSIRTHPLFPIQEQTTPQIEESDTYPPVSIPAQDFPNTYTTESIATTPLLPSQEQTTTPTTLELTTDACRKQEISTQPPADSITESVAPFKRSLTLNELRLFGTKIDTVPETTTTLTDELENEEDVGVTQSTPNSYQESEESVTKFPEITDLFGNAAADDKTDSPLPTDNSSEAKDDTGFADSFFRDDEDEPSALETPTIEIETGDESGEISNANPMITDSDRLPSFNGNPFDFESNLFNLFSFDHLPAMSNIAPNWWSPPPSSNPGQQLNAISPLTASADEVNASPGFLQRFNRYQELDSLLNMRIKDSVSLLQRLFGNFLT